MTPHFANPFALFFALLIGHALMDYPLQGDFLARGKNRFNPIPDVPWYWCMGAHAALQAGAVWALTGIWWLGMAEFVVHWLIDDWKCGVGRLPDPVVIFDVDQVCHIVCKFMWVILWWVTR